MLRQICVHLIPRLRVAREKVHRGPKPGRVVQTASSDSYEGHRALIGFSAGQARAAFSTEAALVLAAGKARGEVVAQLTFRQLKCRSRYEQAGDKAAAGDSLAIAAMTFEHQDGLGGTFVANGSANATAGKG